MAIAWRNVRANRRLRPVDMINGYHIVHPLTSLNRTIPQRDLAHLMYDVFTRLEITYQPQPVPTASSFQSRHGINVDSRQPRVGLFVDAPDHLSGVCLTLAEWKAQAGMAGRELTIHTCGTSRPESGVVSFSPMGSIMMEAYAGLTLHIPRVADVLRYIETMSFDVIHVSTPGPMGLLGLLAARHCGLPVCGTYHTDFPRYASTLTDDHAMEQVGWTFMKWFYGQLDRIAAPTESIRRELIEHDFPADRLHVVGRGVNTSTFNPRFRDPSWRASVFGSRPIKLLYVGRISREKNLEVLVQAFRRLNPSRPDISLVVVGDGPYREEMQTSLADLPVHFTGNLKGEELAKVYASCDLFVFPSKTDTFGRVILEAQASGLPVLVSDCGGPKDAMIDKVTGMVVPDLDAVNFASAIDSITNDPAQLARCRAAALRHAATLTPEASFESFWSLHSFSPTPNAHAHKQTR